MSGWPTIALPQLCRPKQWPTLAKKDLSLFGYPVYGANGRIGFTESFTHEHPTILIGCRGSCGTVHVTEPKSYANGNAMALDNLDTSRVLLPWAVHFFRHRGFADVVTGTSQPQLTQQGLAHVQVPVPPLREQERIVKLLDEADELRKLRAQADRRTADLIPALFHEMFGDMGHNSQTMTIENAVEKFIDYRGKTPEKSSSGVPLVTARIVKGGRILPANEFIREEIYDDWMRRGLPKVGDVLFTTEAPLGEVAIVDDMRIALAQRILLMRPQADLLDSTYFMTALKLPPSLETNRRESEHHNCPGNPPSRATES